MSINLQGHDLAVHTEYLAEKLQSIEWQATPYEISLVRHRSGEASYERVIHLHDKYYLSSKGIAVARHRPFREGAIVPIGHMSVTRLSDALLGKLAHRLQGILEVEVGT